MRTLGDFFSQRHSTPLFHYTSAAGAIGILEHKELWASSIHHLNDSQEYIQAKAWLEDEIYKRAPPTDKELRFIESLKKSGKFEVTLSGEDATPFTVLHMASNMLPVYVASFSEKADLLSQWRAYCPGGDGYALGFDLNEYEAGPLDDLAILKCVYEKGEKEELLTAYLDSWKQSMTVVRLLENCLMVMAAVKHESFEEELEWRLVGTGLNMMKHWRPGRHGIVPSLKIPFQSANQPQLVSVRVGPNTNQDAAAFALKMMTGASDLLSVRIETPDTPYRV